MKKVLFYVSGIGLGGVEKVLLQVLKEIDKSKYDIKIGLNNANENYFENEIPSEINYKYMVPLRIIERTRRYREKKKNIIYKILYSYMLWYEKYIAKKNFLEFAEDREILIDFKSGDYLRLINLFENKKKIVWLHGELSNLVKFRKNQKKFKNNLSKCDKIVLISNDMKKIFEEKLEDLKEKTELIYNPFDFESIKNRSNDYSEIRDDEKELLKDNYIIMVSRLDNVQKDFNTIIKAFKIVNQNKGNIKLYLLGDGPNRALIEKMIKKENLQKNIKLLGAKKNPYPWIKNSKLLVHSSKYEGLPTVLIEALILNKVIVSSDCPTGPREILDDDNYGALVEVGDYSTMAKVILELLQENSLKRGKYLKNIDESIERFDKKNIIKQIENMLERV